MYSAFRTCSWISVAIAVAMLAGGQASAQSAAIHTYKAVKTSQGFSGLTTEPIANTPLQTVPYVFRLHHLKAEAMSARDKAALREHWPDLVSRAALLRFDLAAAGWNYRQTLCPAFPGYLFLTFQHGASPSGSSRFVALLERDGPGVWVIPAYAHGARPFRGSWKKSGTYEVFNRMLRRERGNASMGKAPNWLVIGMCYAELSGFPVQVLTPRPIPGSMMDVLRLKANQPQMVVSANGSAEITFSDIAEPSITANWALHFNPAGRIVSAERTTERQPSRIALKPSSHFPTEN